MNIFYILAIACAAASMAFTYYATKQDGKETEVNLTKTSSDQASEIKRLSSQNIELSNTIFRNTQQITGNGSFPIVSVGGGQDHGNQTQIIISHVGEFALPNLTAKIVVIPNYSSVSGLSLSVIGIDAPIQNLGTLRKTEWPSIMVDTRTKETAVIIYFKADNNSWTSNIRINKTKKGRKTLSYTQSQDGKRLWKRIDPGFPNKNSAIVLWSNASEPISEWR